MSEKRKIALKDILAMLKEGKSRKEINEYYELNPREAKEVLWSNPKLKGVKKAKYSIGIELVEEDGVPLANPSSIPPDYSFEMGTTEPS